MSTWRLAPVLLVFIALVACESGGQRSLRAGMLRNDIGQKAFRTEWGEPDRTMPVLSTQDLARRWGQDVSLLQNAKEVPELWIYDRFGVELVFVDGDLIAWKTNKTPEELRAIPAKP